MKVSRTIADLAASSDVQTERVSEAIQPALTSPEPSRRNEVKGYRNLDRQFWI